MGLYKTFDLKNSTNQSRRIIEENMSFWKKYKLHV